MPGRKKLRRLQWGKESTPGTAIPATAIWRGQGDMLEDQREVTFVGGDELVGILGGTDRSYIGKLMGGLSLSGTPASFEQLPYIFAMALAGPTTGTADGVGSDKIYTTTIPTTSAPSPTSYTIQGGDDYEVEQLEYALITKFELSGVAGEALKVSASVIGRQVQRIASFTGAIALPAIEDILVSKGKVYLDAIGGTAGTTQVANQILGVKISGECKWAPQFTLDGALTYSYAILTDVNISGELTFEHDAAVSGSAGEKANWRNQTPRLLQLKFEGATVATPGTTYSKKTCIINLPIKWKKFNPIGDKDGNDIVVGQFDSNYNTTAGNAGSFIVVNEVAALP